MKIEFSKKFAKQFRVLTDQHLRDKIVRVIKECESCSSTNDISNFKKLKVFKNAYRIKVNEYRIGIMLESNSVIFVSFYHRREFYRFFPRLISHHTKLSGIP